MKKCPNCNRKVIPILNQTLISNRRDQICLSCGKKYGINKRVHSFMTILSIFVMSLGVYLFSPISMNLFKFEIYIFLLFVLFLFIQVCIPFEKRV